MIYLIFLAILFHCSGVFFTNNILLTVLFVSEVLAIDHNKVKMMEKKKYIFRVWVNCYALLSLSPP